MRKGIAQLEFENWHKAHHNRVADWLEHAIPEKNSEILNKTHPRLWQAMRYALLNGGKRFRALLVYAGWEIITDKSKDICDKYAAAVEALHAYSLVHDDLPSIDNDDLRRGNKTCHKVYGEAMAILVGDALHALAFEWMLGIYQMDINNCDEIPHFMQIEILKTFSQAIGHTGMVGGQAMDIDSSSENETNLKNSNIEDLEQELQRMHQRKTGALISASLKIGYIAGIGVEIKSVHDNIIPNWLDEYASNLGLMFQMVDDLLDATQESGFLGKTAGKDENTNKLTYVTLYGVDKTRQIINELLQKTLEALKLLDNPNARLMQISQWVCNRKM